MSPESQPATLRRYDFDWVRIGAFGILILYHIGMLYVPWDFHVKTDRPQAWLEPVMVFINPWRLPLLFLVSGAATRFMIDRMAVGRFVLQRVNRLVPPLLLGMFVIVPPQTWAQLMQAGVDPGTSYGSYWMHYVTASGNWQWHGTPLPTPTWNHLWFVLYLLVYTLVVAAAMALLPQPVRALGELLGKRLTGWRLYVFPVAILAVIRITLEPRFPATYALACDWTVHAESFLVFLFGFLIAKEDAVLNEFAEHRWQALLIGLAGYICYAGLLFVAPWHGLSASSIAPLTRLAHAVDSWAMLAAVLGFAHHHLAAADTRLRRYLTLAVFPFYLIHQTIIILTWYALAPMHLPLMVEASLIVVTTAVGCLLFYEMAQRVGPLRPLFGLSPSTARR
jgi:glucans biosynthesis protein C